MKTIIFYFTGTGNSLKIAQDLAKKLENANVVSIAGIINKDGKIDVDADRIGIVYPVYIWGLPKIIVKFIKKLSKANRNKYFFSIATNGGNVAGSLLQLSKRLSARGFRLSAGTSLHLPSNFIATHEVVSTDEQKVLFAEADTKLIRLAEAINSNKLLEIEKGPLKEQIIKTGIIYRLSAPFIHILDKFFRVDEKCISCGKCKLECPVKNIEMKGGKPVWGHNCELCFRCINYCPKEAIQFGKMTIGRRRYKSLFSTTPADN